jgi:hypothetical protein
MKNEKIEKKKKERWGTIFFSLFSSPLWVEQEGGGPPVGLSTFEFLGKR